MQGVAGRYVERRHLARVSLFAADIPPGDLDKIFRRCQRPGNQAEPRVVCLRNRSDNRSDPYLEQQARGESRKVLVLIPLRLVAVVELVVVGVLIDDFQSVEDQPEPQRRRDHHVHQPDVH